jgi:ATPase subunit of ABC transporter with duplicated ATPase domains
LIGKNGAGKSRILKLVETYFQSFKGEDLSSDLVSNIPITISGQYQKQIDEAKTTLENLKKSGANNTQLQQNQNLINTLSNQYLKKFKQLGQAYIKVVDNDDLKTIKTNIHNGQVTFEQILSNSHFEDLLKTQNLQQETQVPIVNESLQNC